MIGEQHVATSEMLLSAAEPLARNRRTALAAGELVWGAAVHALSAVEAHPTERHRQPRTRNQFLRIIEDIGDGYQYHEDLVVGLGVTQRKLHDHFYTGRFSDEELAESISKGTAFVRQLLQIAAQPHFAGDGSSTA